jgi:hypothetical protein
MGYNFMDILHILNFCLSDNGHRSFLVTRYLSNLSMDAYNKKISLEKLAMAKSMEMSFFVLCPWPRPDLHAYYADPSLKISTYSVV